MSLLNKILLILLPLSNWFFAWKINEVFTNEFSYNKAIFTVLGFLLWGIILGLNLILVKSYNWQILAFILGIVSFFIAGANIYILSALILLFLAFLYARKYVRADLDNLIKIDSYQALYRNLWFFIITVFFLISLTYYISPKLSNYKLDLAIPEKTFNFVFSFIDIAPNELLGIDFGISDLKKSFKDDVYITANNYLNSITKPYEVYIPGALALALFFSLQILSWPLRFLLSIITSFIIGFLTTLGAVKKQIVKVDKEEIIG
ncbi:MAG: hypothetical protein AAB593_01190 [Patescibacteria group bacterium]